MMKDRHGTKHIAFMMLGVAIYLASAASFWEFTVDDAYISARYANNAALGRGFVFNVGERVMGYTSLLYVLLQSVVYRWGGDGLFAAKLVGLASGAGVLFLTASLADRLDRDSDTAGGLLAAGLLAVFPFLPLSSVTGLESSLFTLLVLAGTLTFLRGLQGASWGWWTQALVAIVFAFATVTRPEGLGIAATLAIVQAIAYFGAKRAGCEPRESGVLGKGLCGFGWLGIYVISLLPVLVGLAQYYGSPLPNTFYAKTSDRPLVLAKLLMGLGYLSVYFSESGFYVLLPLMLWPFLTNRAARWSWVVIAITVVYISYVVWVGGDWIPGFRFLLPVLPFCFALAGNGLAGVWFRLRGSLSGLSVVSQSLLAAILLVSLIAPGYSRYLDLRAIVAQRAAGYGEAHWYIGEWLRENAQPDAKIALMDVGIIGFVSDLYTIDFGGLINREIAQEMHQDIGSLASARPTAEAIAQYVLAQHPDYIVLAHNQPDPEPFVGWAHDEAIYYSPVFQRGDYRHVLTRKHADAYFLSLYELADSSG